MMLRRHHKRVKKNEEKRQSEAGREEGHEVETEQEEKDLNDYTVPELKEMAKKQNIEGYHNMKKAELIEALG